MNKHTNDISIFLNQWEIYQHVVNANFMAHEQIKQHLRAYFSQYRPDAFSVLDLGCGDASVLSDVLQGRAVVNYSGVDLSAAALEIAVQNTQKSSLNARFAIGDLKSFDTVIESQTFDVIVAGFSLHHLSADEQYDFFQRCRSVLNDKGILIIYDVLRRHQESRETYLDRYCQQIEQEWQGLTTEMLTAIYGHIRSSDYPQSLQEVEAMAQEAKFNNVAVVYSDALAFHHLLYVT